MLQKELYVTSIKPAPSVTLEMMMEVVPPHLEFQVGLEQRGIMFAAGPLFPSGSELWQGEGLIIVRALQILAHAILAWGSNFWARQRLPGTATR